MIGSFPSGTRGVDCNAPISAASAAAFRAKAFRFAARYIRRATVHTYDLSVGEVAAIHGAGLGLGIVQHVAAEGWTPTPMDGTAYGTVAVHECQALDVPDGVTVWCDLEGVAPGTHPSDVIDFCNNWHQMVLGAGYEPGLYVGYGAGLNSHELYSHLRFEHYWSAYNLDADKSPAIRGVQMRQSVAKATDFIPGFTSQNMDVDIVTADALGGTPTWWLP
jgi:hypothetical protein